MITFTWGILTLCGLGWCACMWGLVCNYRTYKDRELLRQWVFHGGGNWRKRLPILDFVNYDRHMWDRFFLRNPWHRYGADGPPAALPLAPANGGGNG